MKNNDDERFKRRLVGYLAQAGARSIKLSKKREMKLREWILSYTTTELDLSSEPIPLKELRQYIDRWENPELEEGSYNYYYVDKNSNGESSLWERYPLLLLVVSLGIIGYLFK